MNTKAETRSISMEYDLPHSPAKVEFDLHKRLRHSWRAGALDTVVTWTLMLFRQPRGQP
jgi:hypothetical protein